MAKVRFINSKMPLSRRQQTFCNELYNQIMSKPYDELIGLRNQLLECVWDEDVFGTFQGNGVATYITETINQEIKRRLGL